MLIAVLNRNYYPYKTADYDYNEAIIDKHNFAAKAKLPRIFFCGGSNIAFGINSVKIQQHAGKPVINLGLAAGLGLDFIINEAEYTARSGDMVIISPEYYLSIDGVYDIKKDVAKHYPAGRNFFHLTLQQAISDYFIADLKTNLPYTIAKLLGHPKNTTSKTVYSRSSFNTNGDIVRNFENIPTADFSGSSGLVYTPYKGIKNLNEFKRFAIRNHISVYFIYPCMPASLYRINQSVLDKYDGDLQRGLNIKMLNKPADAVYPDNMFYDTDYHLNARGREARTNKIIELLLKNKII